MRTIVLHRHLPGPFLVKTMEKVIFRRFQCTTRCVGIEGQARESERSIQLRGLIPSGRDFWISEEGTLAYVPWMFRGLQLFVPWLAPSFLHIFGASGS